MKELLARLKDNLTGEKLRHNLKKTLQFIGNPRLLLCLALGWLITNGWSYIMFGIGTYLAFLWLPISPEKLVTFAIAIALLRWLFPGDQKTLAVLHRWYEKTRAAVNRHRERRAEEKAAQE